MPQYLLLLSLVQYHEDQATGAANSSELWTGWLNLDVQDSDSAEAKVVQIWSEWCHSYGAFRLCYGPKQQPSGHVPLHTQSSDGHIKWAYTADTHIQEVQGLSDRVINGFI